MVEFKFRKDFDLKEGGEILGREKTQKQKNNNLVKSLIKVQTIKETIQHVKISNDSKDEKELIYEDIKELEVRTVAFAGKSTAQATKNVSGKAIQKAKDKFKAGQHIGSVMEKAGGKPGSINILKKAKFTKRAMSIKKGVIKYIITSMCSMALFVCLFISILGGSSAITMTEGQDNITSAYLYLGQMEAGKGYLTGSGMNVDAEPIMAYMLAEFGMQKTFDSEQRDQLTRVYNQINARGYRKNTEEFFNKFSAIVFSGEVKHTSFQKLMSEGIYTQYKTLGSPFVGKNWTSSITSSWGWRGHPISGGIKLHRGLDIGMPSGTPVNSVCSGRISSAGWNGSYGNCVMVRYTSADTDITVLYAHLSSISVKKGSVVREGSVIGKVGSTGNSTGPHLHIEIMSCGYSSDITKLFYPRIYLKEKKE